MIHVVVVDDEPIARAGVIRLLGEDPDFDIVGEAASGSEAVRVIEDEAPDVVLLDVQIRELETASDRLVVRDSGSNGSKRPATMCVCIPAKTRI